LEGYYCLYSYAIMLPNVIRWLVCIPFWVGCTVYGIILVNEYSHAANKNVCRDIWSYAIAGLIYSFLMVISAYSYHLEHMLYRNVYLGAVSLIWGILIKTQIDQSCIITNNLHELQRYFLIIFWSDVIINLFAIFCGIYRLWGYLHELKIYTMPNFVTTTLNLILGILYATCSISGIILMIKYENAANDQLNLWNYCILGFMYSGLIAYLLIFFAFQRAPASHTLEVITPINGLFGLALIIWGSVVYSKLDHTTILFYQTNTPELLTYFNVIFWSVLTTNGLILIAIATAICHNVNRLMQFKQETERIQAETII